MKSASELPGDVAFRPLRISDLPLLQAWLSLPHVDEWWHEPLDLAGVRAKYLPRIDGTEPTYVFVIERGGGPIGWIQWYRWARVRMNCSTASRRWGVRVTGSLVIRSRAAFSRCGSVGGNGSPN